MYKIDISDEMKQRHLGCIGTNIDKFLRHIADGGAVTWQTTNKNERSKTIDACRGARTYLRDVCRRFIKDDILVAEPHTLFEFAKFERELRATLSKNGCERQIASCQKVFKKLLNYDAFRDGKILQLPDKDWKIVWKSTGGNDERDLWGAWSFIKSLGVRYCPYCNAETVGNMSFKEADGSVFTHQSALDHILPKADYPLLSLSLYNLVPCCPRCNSSFKGSADVLNEFKGGVLPRLNPYIENIHDYVAFDYAPKSVRELFPEKDGRSPLYSYVKSAKRKLASRKFIKEFHLDECYRDLYMDELSQTLKILSHYSVFARKALDGKYPGIVESDIDPLMLRAPSSPSEINKVRFGKIMYDIYGCFA